MKCDNENYGTKQNFLEGNWYQFEELKENYLWIYRITNFDLTFTCQQIRLIQDTKIVC